MTPAEVAARGWDAVDVVFVTGDAYVDHPSFAMALLGRVLEAEGYRVAILSQPDWHTCRAWQAFGRPRLCFAVSAGNMDSMLNRYTANRKVRNDDAYSPGGRIGCRPDRATLAYCQRAREAQKQWAVGRGEAPRRPPDCRRGACNPGIAVPILVGGVEASLRRLAHYDYWSDKVRRSILLDAKAELLIYGMGERPLLEIARRLAAGEAIHEIRDVRGTAYRLGASEPLADGQGDTLRLPSFEEVSTDKQAFVEMSRLLLGETNPYNARRLVQYHGREAVVVNPPALPLSEAEMDRIYGLPFTRRPHPGYGRRQIPAYEVVQHSIQIVRGCFGGCSFCSLGAHQGRIIQSRSLPSVLAEVGRVAAEAGSSGIISDLGGPTANMYAMRCGAPEAQRACRRTSCLWPAICRRLVSDHGPLLELMRGARRQPAVRQVFIASGVRMDLAARDPAYIRALAEHHTGGLLKVAPEHVDPGVLGQMHKPGVEAFTAFQETFQRATAGKPVHLMPYFMAGHPGCDLAAMVRLAVFLKRTGYRPDKVQDFIPLPMDPAACMYHTGIDPYSGKPVYVPRGTRERRLQRALLQFWKPENDADVREALRLAGRLDLVGDGPDCLVPARPRQPRGRGDAATRGFSCTAPDCDDDRPAGYRPHRKSAPRHRARRQRL
jgi:uncharacterized radical SAM protein YgiQ